MHERLVHYLKRIIFQNNQINIELNESIFHSVSFRIVLGYSRNQTAPMSPRSYSAYSNAYGSSASSYGVPSPGFLNG